MDISEIEKELDRIAADIAPSTNDGEHRPQQVHTSGHDDRAVAPTGERSTFFEPSSASLIDPAIVAKTVWGWRWPIVGLTLAGGVLGAMIALQQPKEFTSFAQVLIDPRELQLVERDLTPEFLSNESALAIVDSQLQVALSSSVLEQVISRTNLDQDPEFNGTGARGIGLADGIGVIRSLFADETPIDTTERTTVENLRDALTTDRSSSTFVLNFGVTSQSPRKAARLANEHARAFIERQSTIEAETANQASGALQQRLASLETDVSAARSALAQFRAENNLFGETGDEAGSEEVLALNAALVAAKGETASARARARTAQGINVSSVVSGAVPSDLTTPALTTFRAQYASLRQNAAGLEQTLGPRHPRLAIARASEEAARVDIERELQRIVTAAQTELERAIQSEQEIAAQLAASNNDLGESGQLLGELRRLQSEVTAAETVYQNALVRAREASEIGALGSVNATVLAPAEPPINASSTSRTIVTMAGGMGGFALGAGLAFLMGCINSFRAHGRRGDEVSPNNPSKAFSDSEPSPTRPQGHRRKSETNTPPDKSADTDMYYPTYPNSAYPYPQPVPQQHAAPAVAQYPYQAPTPAYPAPPMTMGPQPQYGFPQQPPAPGHPYAQPVIVPQPQPYFVMPAPAPSAQMPAPAPTPVHNQTSAPVQSAPDQEMEELRQSVSDIRDVLDHLVSSRRKRLG
ncbi:MAG: hypothetical protein AAGG69_12090 [Pseudomonadota bacterium]